MNTFFEQQKKKRKFNSKQFWVVLDTNNWNLLSQRQIKIVIIILNISRQMINDMTHVV